MLDLPLTFLHRSPSVAVPNPWLLVLMHGVGSNEHDLFGLAPHLPPQFHVLSLRAPYAMGGGAFAWFDFTVQPDGGRTIDEAQEVASRARVAQTVASACEQLGIAPERVVVGGFSQGGIMALSLLLTQPALVQAGLVWHSRLLAQVVPLTAPGDALRGKHLWLSHGTEDSVIPLAQAHAIARHVAPLPLAVTYREFPGAHEIRPAELAATVQWLQALCLQPAQLQP